MQNVFDVIDQLAEQASQPLDDAWLNDFYNTYQADVSTRLNYYHFLYLLIRHYNPAASIELGVEYGVASAHMAVAAKTYGGIVIGIDHNAHSAMYDIMKQCANYHFIHDDTANAFLYTKRFLQGVPVGLVFQDSSHHYNASKKEFELYSSLMRKGSIWVCDDILPAFHDPLVDPPGKSMVEYFWELPGYKKLYPEILNHGNTIGVVIL